MKAKWMLAAVVCVGMVGADGSFHNEQRVQMDEPKMSWQIYVVHSRGTACVNFAAQ